MFAKRIGDESLGATPRATNALDAAAVGERLPLLHREGQAPDALASARGRKSRSTAVSLAAVGGALAMVVVCGVALADSATGAKHTSELARADAARAPASAGRLGAHAKRRAERREQRRARRVSLDPSAAGSLGAEAEEAEEATETEEAEPTQTPAEAPTVTAEAPAAAEADEEEDAEAPQAVAEDDLFADAPEPSPEDDLFADAPGPSEPSPEEDALDAYASSPSGAVPFDPSANHVADQKVFADDERGSHTGTPGRLYLAPQDPWDSEESRRRTAHGVLTPARSDRAESELGAGDRAVSGELSAAPDTSRAALAAAAARARAARERKQNAERDWTI